MEIGQEKIPPHPVDKEKKEDDGLGIKYTVQTRL
jgi:hypothetical protein